MSKRKADISINNNNNNNNNNNVVIIDICDSDSENEKKNNVHVVNSSNKDNFTTHTMTNHTIRSSIPKYGNDNDNDDIVVISKSNIEGSTSTHNNQTKNKTTYKVYCDLDGVLVDFESAALDLFNNTYSSAESIPAKFLWSRVNSKPNFFTNLNWTMDGIELWERLLLAFKDADDDDGDGDDQGRIEKLSILTGCPNNNSSKFQKFEWCQRHLQLNEMKNKNHCHVVDDDDNNGKSNLLKKYKFVHVDKAAKKSMHEIVKHPEHLYKYHGNDNKRNTIVSMFQPKIQQPPSKTKQQQVKKIEIITCWSKNKHYESNTNHVLIDDRLKLKNDWVQKGGIFVHHVNTKDTLRQLVSLGIIPPE